MTTGQGHFINNEWVHGTGAEFHSKDPATGVMVWQGRSATGREVDQAVEAAFKAFELWAERPLTERLGYLEAFGDRLVARRDELAEIISRETGKPMWESLSEVAAMRGKIALSVQAFQERRATVESELGGARTAVRFKPQGVVAVFGPFNMPGHLPNGHIVPALLAGNTVVFKPSRQTAGVARLMVELWQDAGLPPGAVNMVQGGRDTGEPLMADHRLSGLFFTGGSDTGKAIHKALGGRPEVILALEMGGNNPLVVHRIADFDAAAYLTIQSAFITAGQRCTCARRLIVMDAPEGDEFIERLISMMKRIRVGAYTDVREPFMGPVISDQVAEDLLVAQEDLMNKGARPLVPMVRLNRPGAFLSPGLMDVTAVRDRRDTELFGPFLQVVRVPDFDAAIQEANNTCFGLAAALLSDDRNLYDRFFRKIRAGVVNWNHQTTGASGKMPFGGAGSSGNHRPSGYYAADYCSDPVASIEADRLTMPAETTPGIDL